MILLGERGQAKTRILRSLGRAARRVAADRRRRARSTTTPTRRSRATPIELVAELGDETPDRLGAPHRALRREARDARHVDRGPDRRGRPDQGRRGPLPLRRARALLRPRAAGEPRHLRHQRAARPRRADPGRACSTSSRSATSRSAGTGSASRSTSCSSRPANPEDYTNRGRIITPLKDRFGAQIRTHYPLDVDTELDIVRNEASLPVDVGARSSCPGSSSARSSRSPSSRGAARSSTSAAASRCASRSPTTRASWRTRCGARCAPAADAVVPRVSDLAASSPRRRARSRSRRWRRAASTRSSPSWSRRRCSWSSASTWCSEDAGEIVATFEDEVVVHVGDDLAAHDYVEVLDALPALEPATRRHRRRGRGRRGDGRARSSSSSRGCTSRSGSARTPRGRARCTASDGGDDGARRYGYRRFDGTGDDDELDAEALLEALTDDLLGGRRPLRRAQPPAAPRDAHRPTGERLEGLQRLMERARRRRQELLERGDPDEQFAEFRDRLDEVERDRARGARRRSPRRPTASGDERRQQVTDDVVAERRVALDVMPDRFADRVDALRHYEFVSSEAREQFEELLAELREQLLGSYFESMTGALAEPDPEQLARLREGMDALSRMLEQRERGEDLDPTFEEFMDQLRRPVRPGRHPRRALGAARARMAAARAMFDSLSADQRAELERLARVAVRGHRPQLRADRLAANLSRAFPEFDGDAGLRLRGRRPARPRRRGRRGRPARRPRAPRGAARLGQPRRRAPRGRPRRGAPEPRRGRRAQRSSGSASLVREL